jgi:hypothetical protein
MLPSRSGRRDRRDHRGAAGLSSTAEALPLTDRQAAIYSEIKKYYAVVGDGCRTSYLARKFSITHEGVRGHVFALRRKGWLRQDGRLLLPRDVEPPSRRAPAPSARTRFDVMKRDKFTCQYCGRRAPEVVLVVDHVVPRCAGGDSSMANLVTSCRDCNQGKLGRPLTDTSAENPK